MRLRTTIYAVTLLALSACASAPTDQEVSKKKEPPIKEAPYKLGVDDRVQVAVWRNPDLSVTVPVRPDGKISVPLIGDVPAAGLTPMEVAASIKGKLGYFIRDPYVSIIVTELQSHEYISRVRVTGAVRNPQSIPYRPGMTVLDAVLAAGGINDFAAPNRTRVHRKDKNTVEVIPIHLGTIMTKGRLDSNINVRPGDVIAVPERLF
jgi:polysaccharide export outer membrane protein